MAAAAAWAVAGLLASVLISSPASALIPQPGPDAAGHSGAGRREPSDLLARRVRQRERALAGIAHAAARYADAVERRAAQVAALGYVGDLDDLTAVLPLAGYHLSAGFGQAGPRWKDVHTGLDLAAPVGTPLVAIAEGTVTSVGDAGAYGLRTVLTLEDGTELWYCHQVSALVEPGEHLEIAEPLGLVGSSGNTTGPHLHLEVRPAGLEPVDPVAWLGLAGLQP